MKKTLLTICVCALGFAAFAQTTLLSQNYNTTDFADYSTGSVTASGTALINNISTTGSYNVFSTATTGTTNDGTTAFSLTGTKLKLERTGARTGGIVVRSSSLDGIGTGGGATDFLKLSAKVEFTSAGTAGTAAEGAPVYFILGNSFGTSVQAGGLGRNASNDNNAQIAVQVALVPTRSASDVISYQVEVPTSITPNSTAPTFTLARDATAYTGEHTLTIVSNNVNGTLAYTALDGVTARILQAFTYDVYIDNTLVHSGIANNPNARQLTGTTPKGISPVNAFKMALNAAANNTGAQNAGKVSFTMDDLLITQPLAVATLPVSLTSFTGEATNTGAKLSWSTVSEQENDRFEVLRSTDGATFSNIGSVKGNGTTSNTNSYSFTDRNPINGNNYYKLNQVDFNGASKEYGPVNVKYTLAGDKGLTANVTNNNLAIKASWNSNAKGTIKIVNLNGAIVKQEQVELINGSNHFNISALNLPNGLYVLVLSDGKTQQSTKFTF